jgi:membrane-associated phospholipid phosphatase
MNHFQRYFLLFLIVFKTTLPTFSQSADTSFRKITIKQLAIPTALVAGGLIVKSLDFRQNQLDWHDNHFKNFHTKADDFLQYTPELAVLGLDWLGIKSKHNFNDRLGVLVLGGAMMFVSTTGLKRSTKVWRPDNSNDESFPSGHTANAFFGAAIVAEEYNDESVWYGIGAYTVATATGTLRVLNNKHWVSDVLVGAGIGMLSAKAAYAIYPWLKEKLIKKHTSSQQKISFSPMYDGRTMGGNLVIGF